MPSTRLSGLGLGIGRWPIDPANVTLATPSDVPMASFCNADLLRGNQPSGRPTTLSGYPLP